MNSDGRPLLFADPYRNGAARATFALAVAGWAAAIAGLLLAAPLLSPGHRRGRRDGDVELATGPRRIRALAV